MRILQVIPVFTATFGGPVTVVRSISKELAKRHDVTVYTTSALDQKRDFEDLPVEVKVDGYHVFYFPRIIQFSGFNISPTMAKMLKETVDEYDVVHLHSWRHFQDIIVHHYAKKNSVPYVLQAHGSLPEVMVKKRLKRVYDVLFGYKLLRGASKVIALSQIEVGHYKHMGVPEEKIAIIPNGIDLSVYSHLPLKGEFRKKYGIPDDKTLILYLGRIHKMKGISFLVEAYACLIKGKETKHKDTILVIAGPDDGYLDTVKSLVRFLGLNDKVLFTGLLTEYEKKCALVDSSFVIYPGPLEPFGLVALEAAACAKPVIVSNNTPMADIVKKGKFGFSVRYGGKVELADIMRMMLSNSDMLKEIGEKGRKFVFQNLCWSKIVYQLESLYKEVIHCKNNFLE